MTAEELPSTAAPEKRRSAIAPVWHTALVVAVMLGVSALSTHSSRQGRLGQNHLPSYLLTIAMEWLMVLLVYWGLRMRRQEFRSLLGEWRRDIPSWIEDLGLAFVFWLFALLVLGAIAALLQLAHVGSPQRAAMALAPTSILEVGLWLLLSITAGICEEILFRGYLQQQFAALSGRVWIGVTASAICFGFAHGYEGASGMLLITIYGALFSLLALRRKSLRTGMMAHTLHDAIAGIALALLRTFQHLS